MKRVASGIFPVISIERKAGKPLHRQIYDAYRTAIVDGRLRPGQRIPSTRGLAAELQVSRLPVLNAYAQLLAEGYVESRIGAGTVVSNSISSATPDQMTSAKPVGMRPSAREAGPRSLARRCEVLPRPGRPPWGLAWGAFGVGQGAFEQFPIRIWASLVARRCRNMDAKAFHYGELMGSKALRETVATYLRTARSVHCEAGQVMIVSGSQQALEISARVLLDPGSRVWVEEPGYPLGRSVFVLAGCRLVPVPVDGDGLDVSAGIQRSPRARAALVTPSHQFPLGVTMSASRRLQLLEWAQNSGAWIIEDDYDSEYRYGSMPIASLQGLDVSARVIYVGTFSKVLFPSLRLGYLVVPPDLVERFLAVRRVMDLCPPTFYQEVLADFISEGHFARHIRRMRVLYGQRRRALVESIGEQFGPIVEVLGDEAGVHLAVALKSGGSDLEIAERAARRNLSIWPLSPSYTEARARQGFILGFGSVGTEEIPGAVHRLRSLFGGR